MPLPAPPTHPRRLVFLGTPDMAVGPLDALCDAGFEVALVVTSADKRRGRGSGVSPTPVKAAALARGLPVTHHLADVAGVGADVGVVVAYGQILRRPLLEALPMVNLHFSLLPRWRGAAPVERAILAGDRRTGVCVMAVEEGLDTGGVYARAEVPISVGPRTDALGRPFVGRPTADDLAATLVEVGSELLVDALRAGLSEPEPQVGEMTYAAKLSVEDRRIDWTQPADQVERVVRVGGAWTTFRGRRLRILTVRSDPRAGGLPPGQIVGDRVGTGDGEVQLVVVQREGKGPVDAVDWVRGAQLATDERLGGEPGEAAGR